MDNNKTKSNHKISESLDVIMEFVKEQLEELLPFTEQIQNLLMFEQPIVIEIKVRRDQEIYYITVTTKCVDIYSETPLFINESVIVNTFIYEKYLIEENKMMLFYEKIKKMLSDRLDKLYENTNITSFDIVKFNRTKYRNLFSDDIDSDVQLEEIHSAKNVILNKENIMELIQTCMNDAVWNGKLFFQYSIKFEELETSGGPTSFSVIINMCNTDEATDITYMIMDVITYEKDRKVPNTYPNRFYTGVALYMNRFGFEKSVFLYRIDPYMIEDEFSIKINNFVEKLYESVNVLSYNKKVKCISIVRKEF